MLTKYLAAALIGSALIAAPALAQTTDKNAGTSAQQSTQNPPEQNASTTGLWQGSKLIGMNVYNNSDEKSGKVDMAVIGVGGFLGMGTHDVAVKFSELKFVDEPPKSAAASQAPIARPGGTTGTATTAATPPIKRNYPDHAMLNASKDQLKAMP